MYIRYTTETILTSLILVSRVWSRPFDVQCEGQRREGDKWFDGCRWCVCQRGGPVCTSSECSIIASQLPACHNMGSSWRDGCYVCKCNHNSIDCTPDPTCLQLLNNDRFVADNMMDGACLEPTDDRCVCGIDGVPSCTAEVIDKNAYPAITIQLRPVLTPPLLSSNSQNLVNSDPAFKKENTRTREKQHDVTDDNSENREGNTVDKSKDLLQQFYSERNGDVFNSQVSSYSFSDPDDHSVQIPGQSGESHIETTPEDEGVSLLVVSSNRCRWGERWYGGRLRCYCGDNSITCGDPGFVASRIDGFRLNTEPCEEGHTWEDKDSCTECTCQISGVAFCHRSPSCLLPFLIKALPLDTDAGTNFEIGRVDQLWDGGNEFTGKVEQNHVWNKTADKILEKLSSSKEKDMRNLDNSNKETGDSAVSSDTVDSDRTSRAQLFLKETDPTLIYVDDIDGSGESNLQAKTTIWTDAVQTDGILRAFLTTEVYSTQTIKRSDGVVTVDNFRATHKCKPKSRWIEFGCKRCVCSSQGVKSCDDSRCPKVTTTTDRNTLPSSSGNKPSRPVQRPPSDHVLERDGPINPSQNAPFGVTYCGRFKPGDKYWEDCNLCECTTEGPKCEAKNCL